MEVSAIPPFPQKERKGWGTRQCDCDSGMPYGLKRFQSADAGRPHEQIGWSDNRGCAAPTGLYGYFLITFPTLKRGANVRCASGAKPIGTSPLSNRDQFGLQNEFIRLPGKRRQGDRMNRQDRRQRGLRRPYRAVWLFLDYLPHVETWG